MARRIDMEKNAADLKKATEKIVTGYAAQDFTDGAGNEHKAGEFTELTQDEFNRTKRHRLLISKDRFEAQQKLNEIDAKERARVSQALNGEDFEDEDEGDEPTVGASSAKSGKAPIGATSSSKSSSKRTAARTSR